MVSVSNVAMVSVPEVAWSVSDMVRLASVFVEVFGQKGGDGISCSYGFDKCRCNRKRSSAVL